ncbi:hypothetical protein EVAR_63870_1 [Eumeta japonica]|uniref:Uncharacterized protein n=1 Tax=Eumeta variegata TaxID=151549 RepID=A0A4C1ZZU3_EUMVA|nr:hypothetical protein EVAR_63870_1 [Eumeta japonica]
MEQHVLVVVWILGIVSKYTLVVISFEGLNRDLEGKHWNYITEQAESELKAGPEPKLRMGLGSGNECEGGTGIDNETGIEIDIVVKVPAKMSSAKNCRSFPITVVLLLSAVSVIESVPSHKPEGHEVGGEHLTHNAQQPGLQLGGQNFNHGAPAAPDNNGFHNFGSTAPNVGSLGHQNYNHAAPAVPNHNGFTNINHGAAPAIPNYNHGFGASNHEFNFGVPATHNYNEGAGIQSHVLHSGTPEIQNFGHASGHPNDEFKLGSSEIQNFNQAAGVPNHKFSNFGLLGQQNYGLGIPAHQYATTAQASSFAGVPSFNHGYVGVPNYHEIGGASNYHHSEPALYKPVVSSHLANDPANKVHFNAPIKYIQPVPAAPAKHYEIKPVNTNAEMAEASAEIIKVSKEIEQKYGGGERYKHGGGYIHQHGGGAGAGAGKYFLELIVSTK